MPRSKREKKDCLRHSRHARMAAEIREGLSRAQKAIPSKYFYDETGSQLFDLICGLPEYYPTATEKSILRRAAADIMSFFEHAGGDLVELGSGSIDKISLLLSAVAPDCLGRIRYLPVDISRAALAESAAKLRSVHPALRVKSVVADFSCGLPMLPDRRKLILFLGSTIGNFGNIECLRLLRRIRRCLSPGDALLLGLDMLKPVPVLEAAYNDAQGITARFNLNILTHINRVLAADFDPGRFRHLAFFNGAEGRIEMHLEAACDMTVTIEELGMTVRLRRGETIHTECSRKFSPAEARDLFRQAGLSVARSYTDDRGWYLLEWLERARD